MKVNHSNAVSTYPLPSQPRILLTSVFGPYAQDDEYGSRRLNPMELYHNQVTREQKAFSLRMFHRSWGIMLIKENISAPCTVLDFPKLEQFKQEVSSENYDIIGITSIIPNIKKVKIMCDLIRVLAPQTTIVVGGHVANFPDIEQTIDADHVVKGEGVQWFRAFLGEDIHKPIKHPHIYSGFNSRTMGVNLSARPKDTAATLIPSVGCPMGCNFCSTSALFGGKGNFINFYETGDSLFSVMCELESEMKVNKFFVMDENFLWHKKRALRLLELMKQEGKSWSLNVFSSAGCLKSYTIEQLVGLGVCWVWMGLEGKNSQYSKLNGVDTRNLVNELQSHGICVLGSTIIGLEEHTPQNIDQVIDYAVSHNTVFHQFMLYTPMPGTPFYKAKESQGHLHELNVDEYSDIHGQLKFNYQHEHIKDNQETEYVKRAFQRDYMTNGPSVMRIPATLLKGWKRYKNHPDKRIRERFKRETNELAYSYPAGLRGSEIYFRKNHNFLVADKMAETRKCLENVFGLRAKFSAWLGGPLMYKKILKEEKYQDLPLAYEPKTFYEPSKMRQEKPKTQPLDLGFKKEVLVPQPIGLSAKFGH